MIQTLHDQYLQSWFADLRNSSKLSTYREIKTIFESEMYLKCINNVQHRYALSRFRCSAHHLNIEEGRYINLERNKRLCNKCNMNCLESEYHFLMVCPFYRDLRAECLPRYYCSWPTHRKFINILTSKQTGVLRKLAKFLYMANIKRGNS